MTGCPGRESCLMIYIKFPLKLYMKHHVYVQALEDPNGMMRVIVLY